jgi:hypothetical protein
MGQQIEINVHNSLNTNTISEDIRTFTDNAAPSLQNTGIERDGGVTNIYETIETYGTAGDHFITEDGNVLQSVVSGDTRLISVDNRQIGITSAYGIQSRVQIPGVDDACISSTGTYLTAAIKGSAIEVNEYSAVQVLLNTRTTTFSDLSTVAPFITSISIVRYNGIKFADSLEFALRMGNQVLLIKESTPTQTIMKAINQMDLLGGVGPINSICVWSGCLVVGGYLGRVSSYDGKAWKFYDGSGSGTGPYSDGTPTGGVAIISMTNFISAVENVEYLVVASINYIASYTQQIGWNAYNKAGTGLWDNNTVVASTISTILFIPAYAGGLYANSDHKAALVVASTSGRIGFWEDATSWRIYSSGYGWANNATIVGAAGIYSLGRCLNNNSETTLIAAGSSGRLGSIRAGGGHVFTTKVYTDASSAPNPTNNGTAVSTDHILSMATLAEQSFVIAGSAGKVAHFYNGTWYNYNSAGGAGICVNNAAVVGAVAIYATVIIGTQVIFINSGGRIGSWDGSNFKNYDGTGTGTGIYVNNSLIGSTSGGMNYNNELAVFGLNPTTLYNLIYTIQSNNKTIPFYGAYTSPITSLLHGNMLENQSTIAYLYAYRYENGAYLINLTGNSRIGTTPYMCLVTSAFDGFNAITGQYAIPQIKNSKTRHIITRTASNGSSINLYTLIGYNDFTTFASVAAAYPPAPGSLVIDQTWAGFGGAEATAHVSTTKYSIYPQAVSTPNGFFALVQSQTNTLVNSFGKLTNNFGVAPSKNIELRVGVINGVMSFYSAAVLDGVSPDAMGTLITNLGEMDPDYTPDFQDDRILYKYNGNFVYVVLGKTLTGNVFQKISPKLYKINSISPLNIFSAIDQKLHVGSSDYHGQMVFESAAASATTATNVASVLSGAITNNPLAEGIFSNSIDVGNKLCYIANPTSANISLIGYRIPYGYQTIKEMISTYISDVYSFSTANDGSELVLTSPSNPLYVEDTRLPVQIGATYGEGVVNTGTQTIFLVKNYDGYTIGNEAKGLYTVFQLFGTIYLFDGNTIYQASLTGDVYSGLTEIAPATGLSFIASTPTQAYFLSAFDNSIYVFTGGRSLTKFQRLSQMAAVTGGIYSARDNALLLETASTFIWVRDDIVTQNNKAAAQTALKLYDTTKGIYIGNDSYNWRYSYASLGGSSTVVPLTWQSSYYGQGNNQKSVLSGFMATIYSPGKSAQTIQVGTESFDELAHYSDLKGITITPSDYSSGNYVRLRIQPMTQRALGTSIKLVIPAKSILVDLVAEFADDAKGIVSGNKTA